MGVVRNSSRGGTTVDFTKGSRGFLQWGKVKFRFPCTKLRKARFLLKNLIGKRQISKSRGQGLPCPPPDAHGGRGECFTSLCCALKYHFICIVTKRIWEQNEIIRSNNFNACTGTMKKDFDTHKFAQRNNFSDFVNMKPANLYDEKKTS